MFLLLLILIAIQRKFHSFSVSLENDDSLLDQLCVRISASSSHDSLFLIVSYIPPNSNYNLYKAHADNIMSLVLNKLGDDHLCVLGDFNLCNVSWSTSFSNAGLSPINVNASHEVYFIDSLLSLNLLQINNFVNKLDRILDLIFISDNIKCNIEVCHNPITPSNMHHVPLLLKFNYAACDYPKLNRLLGELNWESLLSCPDVAKCFATFKSVISDFCFKFIPLIRKRPYKLPWYNRDLKKLKNLRNKFYNKFKASGSQFFFEKYQVHLKKFNCLNKFLYRNYILGIESNIKEDPKSFWHFIKSKKNNSSIPSAVFFEDKCASTPAEVANLFAAFFSSNFVDDNPTVDSSFSASVNSTNFGSLRLSSDDIANGILNLSASAKQDIDGLS
ncbi:PREDICTED: uncharacterized protein LOC108360135 [Rhagoletis zephyria]|uniref:uncharacterized protein LOC108360135 n=1 Tax=Rhagoletis zephyria TaxID=28612 RepID=UPI0008119B42|nr:PREDICTED: uncharacterized protein LOC108360135 [Rhagoletis zephyria]